MRYTRFDILKGLKNIFLVVAGTVLIAFATAVFVVPFNLVAGGVSGLSIIIKQVLPWDFITIDLIITVLTWLLFFVGLVVHGRSFALKTLISTIIYPIGVTLSMKLVDPNVLNGFFYLQGSEHTQISLILAAVVGGAIVGAGCAIAFLGGGSTGGVDIIALLICKVFRRVKSSVAFFIVDTTIIVLGVFVINNMVLSMLGIVTVIISSMVVDKVFLGGSRAFVANIVTERYEELSQAIIEKLDRTTTVYDVVGGYSKKEKKTVMVSFTMRQYADFMTIVNKVDKNAFITIHKAHEINGEGWTR